MTSEKGKSKTRDKGGDKDKSKKKTHHSSHKPKEEKLDPLFRTYGSAGRHFRPDELEVHKKSYMDFHTTFLRTLEEASSMLDKSRTVKVDSDLREINEKFKKIPNIQNYAGTKNDLHNFLTCFDEIEKYLLMANHLFRGLNECNFEPEKVDLKEEKKATEDDNATGVDVSGGDGSGDDKKKKKKDDKPKKDPYEIRKLKIIEEKYPKKDEIEKLKEQYMALSILKDTKKDTLKLDEKTIDKATEDKKPGVKGKSKHGIYSGIQVIMKTYPVIGEAQTNLIDHVKYLANLGDNEAITHIYGYVENPKENVMVVFHQEKRTILEKKKNFNLSKRIDILKKILGMLIKNQKDHKLFHGSLHPDNILLTEKNEPKLADYGFAFVNHYNYAESEHGHKNYIHPEYSKDGLKDINDEKKEKYDAYSLAKLIDELLRPPVVDELNFSNFEKVLKIAEKKGTFTALKELLDIETVSLYGAVDPFWQSTLKESVQVKFYHFTEHFCDYFDISKSEENKDIKEKIFEDMKTNDLSEEAVKPFLGIKHLLRCENKREEVEKKTGQKTIINVEFVTRDNYSYFYSLAQSILYDEHKNPRDLSEILRFFKTLYLKMNNWYGFLWKEEAQEKFRNLILPSSNKCSAFVYAPLEKRGKFKVVIKTNKSVFAKFENKKNSFSDVSPDTNYRILQSVEYDGANNFKHKVFKETIKAFLSRKDFQDIGISFQIEKSSSSPGSNLGLKNHGSGYVQGSYSSSTVADKKNIENAKVQNETPNISIVENTKEDS